MKTLIRTVPYSSRTEVFHLYPSPDIHLGNSQCGEKALADWVKEIQQDDHALWIGIGDYADFINRKDKRYDEEAIAPWLYGIGDIARAQRDRVIATLLPIADKCLGLVKGNHEDSVYIYNERDVYGPLVEEIGRAQGKDARLGLEYWGFIRLLFQRQKPGVRNPETWTCDVFVTHGWWGGQLQGNGAIQLERLAGWAWAHVVLAGHDHKLKTHKQVAARPTKGGESEEILQVCGSCGTFLNGAKYAARKGMRPSPPGHIMVTIEPDKHGLKITE